MIATGDSIEDVPQIGRGRVVVVVGAGAFGGWTALELRRQGARVTLVDAWGPGNARASSGGETRIIRSTYGARAVYTKMAVRAMALWRAHDATWGCGLFRKTGALWLLGEDAMGEDALGEDAMGEDALGEDAMGEDALGEDAMGEDDGFGRASVAALRAEHLPIEELTPQAAAARFPQIAFDDTITSVLWEPEAGYLFARRACAHVVERFVAEGGEYRQAAVPVPVPIGDSPLRRLTLADGTAIEADAFVFACGPWLGRLFPGVVGSRVTATRQEVYYFGTPAGDTRFLDPSMPVWVDYRERFFYGIPGNAHRGFKVADDTPGPPFDPTDGSRDATPAGIETVRAFLRQRFPALAGAPLLGSEVCQYEASPDSHFIIDRHPGDAGVWIVGGGSGHGFKMGPAIGERVAAHVLTSSAPDPQWALARLTAAPAGGWEEKWS